MERKANQQIDTSRNICVVANRAGRKAAEAGAPSQAPTEGYTLLMQRAWVTGYAEGKRERMAG